MGSRGYKYESRNPKAWAKQVREIFGGLEVAVKNTEEFRGTIETYKYGEFTIAQVISNYLKVWHNGNIGTLSETERFLIKSQIKGKSIFSIGTNRVVLNEGEFIICDNARAYTFEFEEMTEIITIPIPKIFIGRYFAHPEDIAFKVCPNSNELAGISLDFLLSIWSRRKCAGLKRYEGDLVNNYFELLVLSFEARYKSDGLDVSDVKSQHLNRCMNFIENNLGREDLSPYVLSKEMKLSRRYVASLFANKGETIGKRILRSRLDFSAQMLRSKRYSGKTIAEIAHSCGFKSSPHYSRVFKDRFSESPREYRKRIYSN